MFPMMEAMTPLFSAANALKRPISHLSSPLVHRNIVVVGAGISGLSCAQRAAAAGAKVLLLSERDSLDKMSPSQGAGGFWMPFRMSDDPTEGRAINGNINVSELARETLVTILKEKEAGGPRAKHIERLPALILRSRENMEEEPSWTRIPEIKFEKLLAEEVPRKHPHLQARVPEGVYGVWYFETVVAYCEPYLENLVKELQDAGVVMQHGPEFRFRSLADAVQKGEEILQGPIFALMNCTGLGANEICGEDQGLIPGRGALIYVKRPATGVDAVISSEVEPFNGVSCAYAIPRGPDLVTIGGSCEIGNRNQSVSDDEVVELRRKAGYLYPGLEHAEISRRWAGLRPIRGAGPCLQVKRVKLTERSGEIYVVHNFGHGGGGWSVMYGCARWCVDRLLENIDAEND